MNTGRITDRAPVTIPKRCEPLRWPVWTVRRSPISVVADDEEEIRMYETSGAYYGYGLYVAK